MKDFVQTKISVDQLCKGMFVARLDRPWVETPFPFQGFIITRDRELELLHQYCQHVYIDMERGVAPGQPLRRSTFEAPPVQVKCARFRVDHKRYEIRQKFHQYIHHADRAFSELNQSVTAAFDQVRVGQKPNLDPVRPQAEKMVQAVIDNPDTFLWLSHLRQVDDYSYHHSVRMSVLALMLGRHIGLNETRLYNIALGCLFADIGNTRISRKLLYKQGGYTEEEKARIRQHVDLGLHIMSGVRDFPNESMEIIATHHERHDGSGYNKGLSGDLIPLGGRIAGLVDTYDAITNPRHHRPVTSTAKALDELYRLRNRHFQDQLVDEFIQAIGLYPSGSVVELNTGETAVVISHDEKNRLRPVVAVIRDIRGQHLSQPRTIDLASEKAQQQHIQIAQALPTMAADVDYDRIHRQQVLKKRSWLPFLKTA